MPQFVKAFTLLVFGSILFAQQQPPSEPVRNAATAPADRPGVKVYRNRVDPKSRYHRVLCIVPYVGAGTRQDPRRPLYTPVPGTQTPSLKGIIGFQQIPTDNKLLAIVEYVAADASALAPILNDRSLQVFERGKHSRATIEQAFKLVRKDFDLTQFGMAVR